MTPNGLVVNVIAKRFDLTITNIHTGKTVWAGNSPTLKDANGHTMVLWSHWAQALGLTSQGKYLITATKLEEE